MICHSSLFLSMFLNFKRHFIIFVGYICQFRFKSRCNFFYFPSCVKSLQSVFQKVHSELLECKDGNHIACQPCKVIIVKGYHKAGGVTIEELEDEYLESQTIFKFGLVPMVFICSYFHCNLFVNSTKNDQNNCADS